jgi:hypothetical protein
MAALWAGDVLRGGIEVRSAILTVAADRQDLDAQRSSFGYGAPRNIIEGLGQASGI